MTTQHTPGPWRIADSADIWAGDQPICTIAHEENSNLDAATANANARLIAAAPCQHSELLAVEKLLAAYVAHQPIEMCAFAERLESVRAVIAKAEKGGVL